MRFTKEQHKEFLDAWLKDLRTTRVKQGTGALHTIEKKKHRYCCLGRACVVFDKMFPGKLEHTTIDDYHYYDNNFTRLPIKVKQVLMFQNECGFFVGDTLIDMNDRGVSFKKIAKVIENRPVGLFKEQK